MNCKYIKTDAEGNIIYCKEAHISPIPVLSGEVIPKGCDRYEQAFIIDKNEVAICDGADNWYVGTNCAAAGSTWSALV